MKRDRLYEQLLTLTRSA